MPIELDELERRRIQLEIEREALRKETDDASKARLEALEKELAEIAEGGGAVKQAWEAEKGALQSPGALLKEEVTADDIAEIVGAWTGIPVSKLMEGETAKLIHMEERLHDRVVGQDEAIAAVADAVRARRAGA